MSHVYRGHFWILSHVNKGHFYVMFVGPINVSWSRRESNMSISNYLWSEGWWIASRIKTYTYIMHNINRFDMFFPIKFVWCLITSILLIILCLNESATLRSFIIDVKFLGIFIRKASLTEKDRQLWNVT